MPKISLRWLRVAVAGSLTVVFVISVICLYPDAPARREHAPHIHNLGKPIDLGVNESYVLRHSTPHHSFYEQLLPKVRYFTHAGYGGHTNQIISIINGAYYSMLSNRVYIVPTLYADHFQGPALPLSKFYNFTRFYQDSNIPMVEWERVKPMSSRREERISCWSGLEAAFGIGGSWSVPLDHHNVDLDLWALPKMNKDGQDLLFSEIVTWDRMDWEWKRWIAEVKHDGLPRNRSRHDQDPQNNVMNGFDLAAPSPIMQLFCLDTTLFLSTPNFMPSYSDPNKTPKLPGEKDTWLKVGMHLRFTDLVYQSADLMLSNILGDCDVPFIGLHIRRGDFANLNLAIPVQAYVDEVNKLQEHLKANGYGSNLPVILTTDEPTGTEFYQTMLDNGWLVISHEVLGTSKSFRGWGPTILDAAILSKATAFVGTQFSTFSAMAALRVKYWNDGLVAIVKKPH